MENCICIQSGEKLPIGSYDRIYIGNEACGLFLLKQDFPNEINSYLNHGYQMGVILPYLTPKRENALIRLMSNLKRPIEIVVNDVGAFRLVKNSIHTPVIGRLLVRQNTDPAILSFYEHQPDRIAYDGGDIVRLVHKKPSQALTTHFVDSPLFSEEAAEILLSGSDKLTIMMDWLPHGMPQKIPDGFQVMLNLDHILVSVLPCSDCESCAKSETLLGKTRCTFQIYNKRNICYYKRSEFCKNKPKNTRLCCACDNGIT